MLETMLITFREGLEAFLIVAITLSYLIKTGRFNLVRPVWAGVLVALLVSATTGWHVAELAGEPVWEGTLALIAGVLVASLTVYVMRTAKTIRQDIHSRIEKHAAQEGALAEIGIFAFTVLMIAREGMETALMLGSISGRTDAGAMMAGAALGIMLVAVIGWLWLRHSHRINLRLFMQVTGIFLVLFSIHLFMYGIHELSEMAALPFLSDEMAMTVHYWTEPFESSEPLGQLIIYSLLAVPCAWILIAYLHERLGHAQAAAE